MSSECRCHADTNFCFYCEMYSPLERKHEDQTVAIKRVIAELEYGVSYITYDSSRASGMKHAYKVAIYKLKEVLAKHEQVPEQKN